MYTHLMTEKFKCLLEVTMALRFLSMISKFTGFLM